MTTIEKESYTSEEVAEMSDEQLAAEFIRITGHTTLSCKHCKGHRSITEKWLISIRARCMKKGWGGLHKDMKLPETCNKQLEANMERNKKYNGIYNKSFRVLYSPMATEEERAEALRIRDEALQSLGVVTKSKQCTEESLLPPQNPKRLLRKSHITTN